MTEPFIASLEAKHKALEEEITREATRPEPDQLRLMTLKKEKLILKEKLVGFASA